MPVLSGGGAIYLPIQGEISIFQYGFPAGVPEIELIRFLLFHLKEGDIFIDGGAHHGFYSLLAGVLTKGPVFSFEPTPRTFEVLKKNCEKYQNIILNNTALWKENTTITFTDFGEKFSECNTFLKETIVEKANNNKEQKFLKVRAVSLDAYAAFHEIIPTFIKLDIEGAERYALEGAQKILKDYSPLLAIEFHGGKNWTTDHDAVLSSLDNYGYQCYRSINGKLQKFLGNKDFNYDNFFFIKNKIV